MLKHILIAAAGALVLVVSAQAQDDSPMSMHGMSQTADTRQLVDFPPPMRQHMLSNMRGHLEALGEILTALSAGDSAKAAAIAETRLGLELPGAASCNPNRDANTSAMATMMAEHMPDEMRTLGFAMHEAASRIRNGSGQGATVKRHEAGAGGALASHTEMRGVSFRLSIELMPFFLHSNITISSTVHP